MLDKERFYVCGLNASNLHVGEAEKKDSYLGQSAV